MIIAIIIVSLIVLSVIVCIARCCCFGLECCCGVCSCCNVCCPSPRRRGGDRNGPSSKYSNGPMGGGGQGAFQNYPPNAGYQTQPPPIYHAPAQFAQFDNARSGAGAPVNADSLPAMPTWEAAASHRVPDDSHVEESHEMEIMTPHDEQIAPMLAHQAPTGGAPHGPYTPTTPSPQPYHDHTAHVEPSEDSFVTGAAAPSPYQRDAAHATSPYAYGEYAQQGSGNDYFHNQSSTLAAAAPLAPTNYNSYSAYSQHQAPPTQPAQHSQYSQQGYGQATYGIADTHTLTPTDHSLSLSPSPPQRILTPASPAAHSPPQHNAALPSALQSGAQQSPMNGRQAAYAAYNASAFAGQQQQQYAAYAPALSAAASDVSSTRYEPSSYGGSHAPAPAGAGAAQWRGNGAQSGWRDV